MPDAETDAPHSVMAKECQRLDDVAYDLRCLARAFDATGNTNAAETMHTLAAQISTAERLIHKSIGEWVSQDLHRAESGSRNVLMAALAGATMVRDTALAAQVPA